MDAPVLDTVSVRLAGEDDFDGFRAQARALLAHGVRPESVAWRTPAASADLFGDDTPTPLQEDAAPLRVPAAFADLARTVALHRDPQRFALLYRLLWRLAHEPTLRHDPLDADMQLAQQMAHAVRRDIHKMRAFLRFRELPDEDAPGGVLHAAWFEPQHHIVRANAPWFARRFANMHWAILTPDLCAEWRGSSLHFTPGASRADAPPADAGEALWLTYYRHIFNPARLKLAMMRKEMPRRYWHNLPEAVLIAPLAAEALERSGSMVEQPPTQPRRKVVTLQRAETTPPVQVRTLDDLRAAAQACRRCGIGACATQAVPGEGPQRPALMFVGEQPGDQEDLAGRPFVGPAGQLFDRAMRELGVARDGVYVTNAVRHFKHELRGRRRIHKTPSQQEAAACAGWLEQEIALVRPHALVALGATAARSLLGRAVAVQSERGWHVRADGLRVFVTLHPAALLRMPPGDLPAAWERWCADLAAAADNRS
jgi:DNA polymerase